MRIDLPFCDIKDCRFFNDCNCMSVDHFERCNRHSLSAYDTSHSAIRIEAIEEFWNELQRVILINNTNDGCLDMAIDWNCLVEDGNELVNEFKEKYKV